MTNFTNMFEKTHRSGLIKQQAYRIFTLHCEPISLVYLKKADAYIMQYYPIRIMIKKTNNRKKCMIFVCRKVTCSKNGILRHYYLLYPASFDVNLPGGKQSTKTSQPLSVNLFLPRQQSYIIRRIE